MIILPNIIHASSTKDKIPTETGFYMHITNNSLAISQDEQIAVVSDCREQFVLVYDLTKDKLQIQFGKIIWIFLLALGLFLWIKEQLKLFFVIEKSTKPASKRQPVLLL